MADKIQFRRDTAANWASVNPLLSEGEMGLVTDTGAYKIGNGVDNWNSLTHAELSPAVLALDMTNTSDPGAATDGHMTIYSKTISNRAMLKMVGPSGLDTALQPFLARNKVGIWIPPGSATTVPGVFGYTAPTAVGTVKARVVATTNLFTRMRRLGYETAATAGTLVSARVAAAQVTTGTGTLGGFHKIIRFGISDPTIVADARMFVGVCSSTSAPTNVEPSTLKNCVGIGHGAADTTMHLYSAGSVSQTPIDLGANFPIDTNNTDVYELSLFAPTSAGGDMNWEVTRLNTGHKASGTLTPSGGSALPGNTTLLTYHWAYRTNNTTAAVVGIDWMGDYIETDY